MTKAAWALISSAIAALVAFTPTPGVTQKTLQYEIITTEDLSFGEVRRLNLRVSLLEHYSKDEILVIARSEIDGLIAEQPVNAISIMFFAPGTSTRGAWDVGAVDWAPNGRWSDADTVRSGDYRNFAYSITYKPPPQVTAKAEALSPSSSDKGLLGAPLPASATLISRTPGDMARGRDPVERYRLQASSGAIVEFYLREMPKHGWEKDGASTGNVLLFRKGSKMLGVLINREGGTFSLMGS